jgi:hypothetical protein
VSEWQPIESAPKDHVPILVVRKLGGIVVARRKWEGWYTIPGDYGVEPTHWMLLPPPPIVQERARNDWIPNLSAKETAIYRAGIEAGAIRCAQAIDALRDYPAALNGAEQMGMGAGYARCEQICRAISAKASA